MTFLLFILLILFLLIGLPVIKGWLYMRRLRNKVNETFRQQQEYGRRNDSDDNYAGSRKKYSDKDGEYAEFEDVKGTTAEEAAPDSGDTRTVVEEQVTDAEFEEIK